MRVDFDIKGQEKVQPLFDSSAASSLRDIASWKVVDLE